MFAGWFNVGARFTLFTVIVSDFWSARDPSLTRTVAAAVPAFENPGAKCRLPVAVPVPGAVVVTDAYVGPDARLNVSAFPRSAERRVARAGIARSCTFH